MSSRSPESRCECGNLRPEPIASTAKSARGGADDAERIGSHEDALREISRTAGPRVMTFLEAALELASRGWPVFPVKQKAKKPPMTRHGLKDATTDPEQIRQWWDKWPNANIAIALTPGVGVLDEDPQHGGDKSLKELQAQFGPLPATLTVRTGGGGTQRYFATNGSAFKNNNTGAIGPGLDFKTDGGYVMAPTSIHPNGKPYEWVCTEPMAPLPQWIAERLTRAQNGSPTTVSSDADTKIPYGQHDAELTSIAGKLRRDGIEEQALANTLIEICEKRCEGYGPDYREMCAKIARSVSRYEPGKPANKVPTITLRTGELPNSVDEAEDILLTHAEQFGIFQRAGELVRVTRLPEPRKNGGLKRPEGIVILEPLRAVALTEIFERLAVFQRFNKKGEPHRADCPPRLAATYLARTGEWRLFVLAGVISAPLMREDGTILARPGFDEETGLYLVTDDEWPSIPECPTREDASKALETLLAPFAQFPFVEDVDRAVHAAAILTGIQRRVLRACPLFAYSAPAQRSGKSLLAESVAIIATGKPAAATGVSPECEELRKAVTASLREGHAIVNLDNIDGVLASPDLARAITQIEYADRLLGENKMLRLPTNVLWTATGNNLTFRGDLSSRTLLSRIDAGVERPEERKFKIPNLSAHLTRNRKHLVVAALTILRAYHVAQRPRNKERSTWGGFEDWSDSIREPLIWAGMPDPCETRTNVLADDPELEMARSAFTALRDAFGDAEFLVREVIERCDSDKTLRGVMLSLAQDRDAKDQINSKRLGSWCRRFRGRVLDGLRLLVGAGKPRGATRWSVSQVSQVSQFPTDAGGDL